MLLRSNKNLHRIGWWSPHLTYNTHTVFSEPGKASIWEPFANFSPSCLMLLAGAIHVPLHTTTPRHSLSMCLFENTEFLIEVLFCLPLSLRAVSGFLKENNYGSEGCRFEPCRTRYSRVRRYL